VPAVHGGSLTSLDELLAIGRVVAGRDPTVAVIANSPLAAAMPVWLAGTAAQQSSVATAILDGQHVALGLTEVDHGADLLATEVTGLRTANGFVLHGTKWLINNVRLARYVCLLVREPARDGVRSLTLLLLDMDRLPASSYEYLPRIRTHGIRGADIAGIRFHGAVVPETACIGKPGRGLELTAQSLLVTRTLVPGLSIGGLDTALRCTVDFLQTRALYGSQATDIPLVQDELAATFLDLSVAAVVANCCVQTLQTLPGLAAVASAVAKYLVPHLATARMRTLSTTLGARYYLCDGHWSGIFEKLLRDVRLFALFDGSEPVVLSALAAQASCLTQPTDPRRADELFNGNRAGPGALGIQPFDIAADDDPVTGGLAEVCCHLERHSAGYADLHAAVGLLRARGADLIERARIPVDPRSALGQQLGESYAQVFAAVCLSRSWINSALGDEDPSWLAAGLVTLLRPGSRMPRPTSQTLFAELTRQCSDRVVFLGCFAERREVHDVAR